MTIAAGFTFSDGILFCADTEETYGSVLKVSGSKIFPIDFGYESGILCFAVAGSVSYAKMAIEKIREEFGAKRPGSHSAVRGVIERNLTEIYKGHILQSFVSARISSNLRYAYCFLDVRGFAVLLAV